MIYILSFFFIVSLCVCLWLFTQLRLSKKLLVEQKKHYETEMADKARDVAQIVEDLRSDQFNLFESGKISALASLSASILHQISQPITAIHGFAKFLKKEMNSEEAFYKPISLIDEEADLLVEKLGNLRELIDHRKIKKENININDVIKRSMGLLMDELRTQNIKWEVQLQDGMPNILADRILLQQSFMNIVINSMQALETLPIGKQKYISIASDYLKDKNEIDIAFEDTGPGIMDSNQYRVFEPFFTTKYKGKGIGLALCKNVIEEHGGEILVESQKDKGTKFIIKLPIIYKSEQYKQ